MARIRAYRGVLIGAFASFGVPIFAIAAEEGGGMPQLDASTYLSQLFWLVLAFAVLFWVMSRKALPLVSEILNLRDSKIRQDLDAAEKLKKQAESLQAEIQQDLADAQASANDIFKRAHEKVAEYNVEQSKKTDEAIEAMLSEATANIAESRNQAIRDINASTVDITQAVVAKLGGGLKADGKTVSSALGSSD